MPHPSSVSPVITGLGIVAAPGCGPDEVWRALSSGVSGLRPLSLFESPRYGQVPVGEIPHDLSRLGAPLRGSRSDRLGWIATRQAIKASGILSHARAERIGLVLGCSVGGSFDSERFLSTLIKHGRMRVRPTRFHECASAIDLIAEDFGLLGPSLAVATACSSGALAIATAAEMILAGEADVMLAGGADSLSRMTWGGFHSLLVVDPEGCRPFDSNRAGMSLGEGAAIVVLESAEFARRRGARTLARLSGWGASCDAYHPTAPHPEGAGAKAAMQSALARAGLDPAAIGYVNAHGTGTRDNDLAEAKALRGVFGDRLPPVSSTKRFFGHALAASGAIEAVVCVQALAHQQLPPNLGFSTPDPAIPVQPITTLQPASLSHVMSNSFGFGGNNVVLIFSSPETSTPTRLPQRTPMAVISAGVVRPTSRVQRQIEAPLPAGSVTALSCGTLADAALLTPNQRRRSSRLVQMALVAARKSHTPDPSQRLSVAIGTGMGCLEDAGAFLENLISKDEREPMPTRFPNSVHNAASSQVAIDQGAHALNSAPTMGEISFEAALWQAVSQIAAGEADCALAGAVDELNKYVLSIGQRWGLWTATTLPGEGAVVASIEPARADRPRLAQVTTVRLGRYRRPFDAKREADWIAAAADLGTIQVLLSGAKGAPTLDPMYDAVANALSTLAGRAIEHQTYKNSCGEFHSASAFGFCRAVDLVRSGCSGVLLYTLSLRGAKAICVVQP